MSNGSEWTPPQLDKLEKMYKLLHQAYDLRAQLVAERGSAIGVRQKANSTGLSYYAGLSERKRNARQGPKKKAAARKTAAGKKA